MTRAWPGRHAVVLPRIVLGDSPPPPEAEPGWVPAAPEPPKSFYAPQAVVQYLAPLYVAHDHTEMAGLVLPPPILDTPAWLAAVLQNAAARAPNSPMPGEASVDGEEPAAHQATLAPASRPLLPVEEESSLVPELADPALARTIPLVMDLQDPLNYSAVMDEVALQREALATAAGSGDTDMLCVLGPAQRQHLETHLSLVQPLWEQHDPSTAPPELAATVAWLWRRLGYLDQSKACLDALLDISSSPASRSSIEGPRLSVAPPPGSHMNSAAYNAGLAEAHWQRCLLRLVRGRPAAALEDLAVLCREGKHYKAFRARADLLLAQGQAADALTSYDIAIVLYDRDAEAFVQRASAYAALSETVMASEDLRSAVQLNPRHTLALRRRAVTEFRLGRFAQAAELFSDVLQVCLAFY